MKGMSNVIDLKYDHNPALWTYQIETLKMWALLGVDGFRCDVAPLLPLDFWLQARRELALGLRYAGQIDSSQPVQETVLL